MAGSAGAWAVGALAILAMGCGSRPSVTRPSPYDGDWVLARQYRQEGGVPDPPNPLYSTKYSFDSKNQQYRVRWESSGRPGSPADLFHQVFSVTEVRPGVLRMGDPRVGFDEYAYRVDGDEMTMEFVGSTVTRDVRPPPTIEITTDKGTIEEEVDVSRGPPGVMVLTRSPK